jgi:hypothetical protein
VASVSHGLQHDANDTSDYPQWSILVKALRTATQTAKRARGRPFQKGHDARRGYGKPGRSGGKPWSFREDMRRALIEGNAGEVTKKIIAGDLLELLGRQDDGTPIIGETKNADRIKAMQFAASYAEGLPVQPTVDLTPQAPAHLTGIQLAEALPRLVGLLPGKAQDKARLLEAIEADYEVVE